MEEFKQISLETLLESPLNPRRHYDLRKIEELAQSMGSGVGVIEPLVVRRTGKSPLSQATDKGVAYEIVAGNRRYRAAKLAALGTVPAVIRDLNDQQTLEIMVIENNQREDTNALEEAEGYERLLKTDYTLERLADKIGKSHKYVYDRLKLLQLVPEAKTILLSDRMTAGHAILLARLKPNEQERAIDVNTGGLFEEEHTLFDEDPAAGAAKLPKAEQKYFGYKARSVRELEAWIDENVRFDRNAPIVADLFPETAAAVKTAAEEKEKIIQITHDHYVQPDAKEGNTERIYTEVAWKLADGSSKKTKACEKSVTGVVVIGPERGTAHKVCVHKECPIHWGKEKRERERHQSAAVQNQREAAAQEKARAEQQREQERRDAFEKNRPALLKACLGKIKTAKFGELAKIVYGGPDSWRVKNALKVIPKPKSIEDLGRLYAAVELVDESRRWNAHQFFPARAKLLGVHVATLVKPAAESQSNGKEELAMATKKKAKDKKKSKNKTKKTAQATA